MVADCWVGDGWVVRFRRTLGANEMLECDRFMSLLDNVRVQNNNLEDSYYWIYEESGYTEPDLCTKQNVQKCCEVEDDKTLETKLQ